MANNTLKVDERQREIGNFMVGRLLPFAKKRQVGPFTFIDHMGPAEMGNVAYMDVDQHPHIGLSTLTYLMDGAITHRDSTRSDQLIAAGDVGFMTAGKGVTHTERTPNYLRTAKPFILHGYQIWVALPKANEEDEPHFQFIPKSQLPKWSENGLDLILVAGEGFGRKSPLKVHSDLFMVDISSKTARTLAIAGQLQGEIAVVVTHGSVMIGDENVEEGQMLISKTIDTCSIELSDHTRVLLFGGQPLPEERYLMWNFVSSSKDRLKQAKSDLENKRFPKVLNDETYIPYPPARF
jgi:redox-sensitive bicupin YhaK (pirin superfamily)